MLLNIKELNQKLIFHSDAGHGWLSVPEKIVKFVGFRPSQYSYYNHKTKTLFLEEDCDASGFIKLAESKGFKFEIVDQDDGDTSPIRRLSRCG